MTNLNEMFEKSPYFILEGDCLERMKDIPSSSVNLVCTDLPYNTTNISWDKNVIDLDKLWEQYERILVKNGTVLLFGNQPFTSKLVMSNPSWFKQALVWNKSKCGSPGLAKYRPMQVHEDILVFCEGTTTYNPIMEEGTPYKRNPPKQIRCNHHGYGFSNDRVIENKGTRYPKSIINISRDFSAQQQIHPTQKPVPLLEWLINTYSNIGDVVIDSTMGSGSTGVACMNTKRYFVGCELDPSYVTIARARVESVLQSVDKLFGD